MEIQSYFKLLRKKFINLIVFSLAGAFLFLVLYLFMPEKYLAEGTVFVYPVNSSNQKSEVSNELNYSRNIIALSNSPEFKNLVKNEDLSEVSFTPLVGIAGGVKLREISPNILSLSFLGNSKEAAERRFVQYFSLIQDFSKLLNKGNSSFEISLIQENPIVTRIEKNLFLYLMLGLLSGFFVFNFSVYLRHKND
jgi:hypothetical protein